MDMVSQIMFFSIVEKHQHEACDGIAYYDKENRQFMFRDFNGEFIAIGEKIGNAIRTLQSDPNRFMDWVTDA